MTIDIKVYAVNQFTKYGALKKKAKSDRGFMMVDVEPYTKGATDTFLEDTAKELKKEYKDFESPYIFTSIIAKNRITDETVYIFETCNDLITSPVKLLALLK